MVDEIKQQVTWQCQHLSGDFKLIHAVLDLFAALVEHVQGCSVLARDRLLYDTVTRVMSCPALFSDTHVNTRLLELIDQGTFMKINLTAVSDAWSATRVNQHALFGNISGEVSDTEQCKCQNVTCQSGTHVSSSHTVARSIFGTAQRSVT